MKKTAIDIIRQIHHEVEDKKLPLEVMVRDIQMMQFKVRSILGDISDLETAQYDFIHALWRIGKIDEIVYSSLIDLDEEDQEALIAYFADFEGKSRSSISQALTSQMPVRKGHKLLKIEIFKEGVVRSMVN